MNAFPPEHYALEKLENQLNECLIRDRRKLYRQGNQLRRRLQMGKPILRDLAELEQAVEASKNRCVRRRDALPSPEFDSVLPINQKRGEIADALRNCQVVVLCGETGSGKTTQLPKICLELGLGAAGTIGHTQPRRIAARSVATRIAEELHSSVGGVVGYKVRFGDRTGENTIIKLMTDGILLAETQSDRYLEQYEVIIIDEAHERSLNIDFLLGYLHRLLPSRRDLKLIVTSATIDPERFSRHFHNAPIIEVSGRTYPVEIRYRPLIGDDDDERDRDSQQAILEAVDEVSSIDRGDLLIFLNGEREIRETAESLRKHHPPATEILPLFARLSAAEQNRIFQPHGRRRIVLATNVAETSLTVPGIRYVIDPGTARISRYSHRSKLQRLPIEKISQASADQRAGRCGRVSAGICIRLYGEEDFRARPPYTDPEILRTNLAAVILQMSVLGLGDVANFPFIDSPDSRLINDGFKLLYELQAVDEQHRVTDLGRQLARLPIDPRLGRMILAAHRHGSLKEVLVIGSALAIQDPRERPLEHRQAADEKHRRFYDERSDFLSLLKLWEYYHEQARKLSRSKLRSLCQQEFLSFVRMREWHDLHQELHGLVTEMGFHPNELPADYNSLHQALLTGLLGHLGARQEDRSWLGARGRKFFIFPGSGLFKKSPRWVMAAEMVETSKIYARTVANIEPEWIEPPARHLVKRSYSDPHWEKRAAQVAATERVTLYGLTIVSSRKINYGPIAPAEARTLFIRHALVRQEYHSDAPYARQQRKLIDDIEQLEAKTRRRDLLVDEDTLFRFYDERVPPDVNNGPRFERWRKQAERDDPRLLFLTRELLLNQETAPNTGEEFPDTLDFDGLRLPLSYCFMPGAEDDGVTLTVPLAVLNQLDARRLEWLVPGLLGQRIAALLKSLPKALRRHFVPVPNYVRVLLEVLVPDGRRLTEAIATYLHKITGVAIPPDAWQAEAIQDHLRMRLRVLNADGSVLVQGRDLETIKKELEGPAQKSFAALPTPEFERDDVHDWDFGDLPLQVEFERNGIRLKGYPTVLAQEDGSVALRLVDAPERAERLLKSGVRRMLIGRLRDPVRYLKRNLPGLQQMSLYFVGVGTQEELRDDLLTAILNRAFLDDGPLPRSREAFEACLTRGKPRLQSVANELCTVVREALAVYHEVRKILNEEDRPLGWSEALEDIQDQLDWLVYKGFITQTPAIWLNHLPRYLQAIEARLRKIKRAPDKDRQRRTEIGGLWQRYKARWRENDANGIADPALEQFRWMVEEYRVSAFAQELKTAMPVSLKRLEEQWKNVIT